MKKTLFHGTNADNLQSIIDNGLTCYEPKIWSCSTDGVFAWEIDSVASSECLEDEDFDTKRNAAFRLAYESAQMSMGKAKDCRAIVIEFEIDETEITPDDSCPNMDHASVVYRDVTTDEIKAIHVSNDLSLLKGYFISLIANRDYNNIDFNEMELRVAKCFEGDASISITEEIEYMTEWSKIELAVMA